MASLENNEKLSPSHKAQKAQLKRIAGQVQGVANMIEEGRYCVDILTLLKAIKASIGSVERKVMSTHLDHCVHRAFESKDEKKASLVLEEIKGLMRSFNR